jgi:hypothetical protein
MLDLAHGTPDAAEITPSTGPRFRFWDGRQLPDGAGHQGIITTDGLTADYYTSQPAATQWIAVAVVVSVDAGRATSSPRMLVGNGSTEESAVTDLEQRLARSR